MHIDKYKTNDGYIDANGSSHEEPVDVILTGFLGFCGCGSPDAALGYLRDVLMYVDEPHHWSLDHRDEWKKNHVEWRKRGDSLFTTEGSKYLIYYVLDKEGLTEHGGCVPGWLSSKGREILEDAIEILSEETKC